MKRYHRHIRHPHRMDRGQEAADAQESRNHEGYGPVMRYAIRLQEGGHRWYSSHASSCCRSPGRHTSGEAKHAPEEAREEGHWLHPGGMKSAEGLKKGCDGRSPSFSEPEP